MKATLYPGDRSDWEAVIEDENSEGDRHYSGPLDACLKWIGENLGHRVRVAVAVTDPDCECHPQRPPGLPWYAHFAGCPAREEPEG